jgi:uncharacterized membrane protein YeaQ/YmgE (transglycosylase-associated protein family)
MLGVLQLAVLAQENADGDDVTIGSILLYIVVGAVIGVLARFLVPGEDPLGFFGTIALGIVGAVIGGWLAGTLFGETEGVDWIASIVVAVLLVLAVRMFRRGDVSRRV